MTEQARKIAAILAADVVEYSRLMGADEAGTLAALKIRRALFERRVKDFDGREFGSVGDSLMAQFPSAVNAVRCAQAIQQAIGGENEALPAERRMRLRIGINLGDVIEENGALFGDGVNIAARLQSLAAPGGILISGSVHEQVRKKVPATLRFAGTRQVKNIAEPVATYEVLDAGEPRSFHRPRRWPVVAAVAGVALIVAAFWYWRDYAGSPEPRPAGGTEPSVAVLPFVNMSSEPDNEPFADGLSEEVLNMLAGIEGLKVAGRTSSFYYKGKNEKTKVIAATLGVNHLLEGSVRWAGPKVRITAQLIDASNGFHLWSETFDREAADVFAVQEEIARAVAAELRVKLLPTDETHLARRGTHDAEAHRLYLVARGRMRERGLANLRAAKALFEQALGRDPNYASAHAGLADAYFLLMNNHLQELENGARQGMQAVTRALELDPSLSEAYASRANFSLLRLETRGDSPSLEQALGDYRRAIELDPSNAQAHHWYANAIEEQDPDAALRSLERAVELDPLLRQAQLAVANVYVDRGEVAQARERIEKVIHLYPDFAGAYRTAGDLEYRFGDLPRARTLLIQAYELEADPFVASGIYLMGVELGDPATVAEWKPRIAGNPMFDLVAGAADLSLAGRYPQALEVFRSGIDRFISNPWYTLVTSQLELIGGEPQRAEALLLRRYPDLLQAATPIRLTSCDSAIALAAALQRTGKTGEAGQLLQRIAAWLDGPRALRRPQRWVARAQVHALRGERDAAFAALDRAFAEGHRNALGSTFMPAPYRGEDHPAYGNLRGDPRLAAWFARIRADNARQLAQFREQNPADG
jgi:adenylate cyclase